MLPDLKAIREFFEQPECDIDYRAFALTESFDAVTQLHQNRPELGGRANAIDARVRLTGQPTNPLG